MNIEFEYMYRDFGNFKNYGAVVFGNRSELPTTAIIEKLISALGHDRNFMAADLGLPDLFFKQFAHDPDLDWDMHEFCDVAQTDQPINDSRNRDIEDILRFLAAHRSGRASEA